MRLTCDEIAFLSASLVRHLLDKAHSYCSAIFLTRQQPGRYSESILTSWRYRTDHNMIRMMRGMVLIDPTQDVFGMVLKQYPLRPEDQDCHYI